MIDWTPGRTDTLRALWAEGHSCAEIARRMGITKNAAVGQAHRMKLPKRESPIAAPADRWTPEEDAMLRHLRGLGCTLDDIAARIGRPRSSCGTRAVQLRIPSGAPATVRRWVPVAPRNDGVRPLVARGAAVVARARANSIGAAEGFRTRGADGGGLRPGGLVPAAPTMPAAMAGDPGPAGFPGGAPRLLPRGAPVEPSSTALPPAPVTASAVFSKRCRFPLWGHMDRPDHRYCDAATAVGAYCAEHAARCYAPPRSGLPPVMGATVGWGGNAA